MFHHITIFLLKNIFYTFALVLLLTKLFKALLHGKNFLYPLYSFKPDLLARYGRDSWAIITGSSDGIGKAFAFELAKNGFNIILYGRNRNKLEEVEKELKSIYQSTHTRIVVQDSNDAPDEDFSKRLLEQLRGLDVSFLINNAATGIHEEFANIPLKDIKETIMVNAMAPALVTRTVLPLLAQRKKSALITVSSIASEKTKSESHLYFYGATKAFVDFLTRGLKDEHKNIDFLVLKPAFVSTKMTGKKPGGFVVYPEEVVKSTLRALGHTDVTHGSWKHGLQASMTQLLPDFLRKKVF